MLKRLTLGLSLFVLVGLVWQLVVFAGYLPAVLFPDLRDVVETFISLLQSGVLVSVTLGTLGRLLLGFTIGSIIGVSVGILMGRYRWVEDFLMPLVSLGYPIPALAYAPLFVLWFGLGNLPSIILVAIAATFQITINTWKGVSAVKPIWLRSAEVMGASERMIFTSVMLPASLPYILTGLRLGLGASWRVLIGVEMITAVTNGLGSMIFGARQFLQTDVMLSGVLMIAIIGLLLEKYVFSSIEKATLYRWGMLST